MINRKQVVERYFEGFRRGDHAMVLGCLTDDVVWDLPGLKHLEGKEAFDGEIENDAFEARPALEVDRLVEEAATVVAIGTGRSRRKDGMDFRFAFADVFTFRGEGSRGSSHTWFHSTSTRRPERKPASRAGCPRPVGRLPFPPGCARLGAASAGAAPPASKGQCSNTVEGRADLVTCRVTRKRAAATGQRTIWPDTES